MDTEKLQKLVDNRVKAMAGGGEAATEKHHAKGAYTCRERINMLLDEGSFEEYDMFLTHRCHDFGMEKKVFLGDGVAVGSGTIDGRLVYVFAQDATVIGGSLSETMAQKICHVMDEAMKMGAPIIGLNDSGGARIQEGACALAGYAEIFERNILASGVVPQISVIFGPCAGGAVYSPALTDFIMMTEQNSYMFITGPKVVKSVTGEDVTVEQLGGAKVHASKSGVTHFVAPTEDEALAMVRKLVSFIPQNNMEEAPLVECTDDPMRVEEALNDIVPSDPNKPYNMKDIINLKKLDQTQRGERIFYMVDDYGMTTIIVVRNACLGQGDMYVSSIDGTCYNFEWSLMQQYATTAARKLMEKKGTANVSPVNYTLDNVFEGKPVYEKTDQPATFLSNGMNIRSYLTQHLRLPEEPGEHSIGNLVKVSVVIDENGQVNDVAVVTPCSPSIDREVVRVVKTMPLWTPATVGGQNVCSRLILPIDFK